MTKNQIVTVYDRCPEQTARKKLVDLLGEAGRIQLAEVNVSDIDRIQIDRGLEFIGDINERIKRLETTIRAMTKANANVKRLKTIPGSGEFFARLFGAEIDGISRFRNAQKLAAYAGLLCRRPVRAAARPIMARSSAASSSIRPPEDQINKQGAGCHRAQAFDDCLPDPA